MSISPRHALPVLVVDDEARAVRSLELLLHSNGIENVICCQSSRQVLPILEEREIGVITLDLNMPEMSGEELLPILSGDYPEVPIIVVTGVNDIKSAVDCIKLGAFDYVLKPVEESHFTSVVRRALELRELRLENVLLTRRMMSDDLDSPEAFEAFVTGNPKMRSIFRYLEAVAKTSKPVMITGETGTGKELLAKAVHILSQREGPFVAVNVGGLDDSLFSDTLFGHRKGAYTGADSDRGGMVDKAAGGTLFLDEIGDLCSGSQIKLLRLLQEREYYPLGADVAKVADVRIIVATNQDLEALQSEGRFRKDLYFRLKMHHVHVPPLRERIDDLPLLLSHFLEKSAEELGKKKPTPPAELITLLSTYHFPGNVRELESMVYDAVSRHESRMLSMDVFKSRISVPKETADIPRSEVQEQSIFRSVKILPTLSEASRLLVAEAMRRSDGNQKIAAELLGISQPALSRRLKISRK